MPVGRKILKPVRFEVSESELREDMCQEGIGPDRPRYDKFLAESYARKAEFLDAIPEDKAGAIAPYIGRMSPEERTRYTSRLEERWFSADPADRRTAEAAVFDRWGPDRQRVEPRDAGLSGVRAKLGLCWRAMTPEEAAAHREGLLEAARSGGGSKDYVEAVEQVADYLAASHGLEVPGEPVGVVADAVPIERTVGRDPGRIVDAKAAELSARGPEGLSGPTV